MSDSAAGPRRYLLPGVLAVLALGLLAFWVFQKSGKPLDLRIPGTDNAPDGLAGGGTNPVLAGKVTIGEGKPAELAGAWPMFRGPMGNGISPETNRLARTWPATGPAELWAVDLGEGYAGPAILNGRVYLMDYDREKKQDALRCLSLADGKEIWRFAYPVSLIIGHNGMARLFGSGAMHGQDSVPAAITPTQNNTNTILDDGPQRGGAFQNEIGTAGTIRFFITPLAKEMSWLLPLGLIGVVLALLVEKIRLPIESDLHKALLLWGGWLITCVVFFSIAGFFHAYYMIMLVPALGGAMAFGGVALWKLKDSHPRWAAFVLIASSIGTLGFQLCLAAVALGVMRCGHAAGGADLGAAAQAVHGRSVLQFDHLRGARCNASRLIVSPLSAVSSPSSSRRETSSVCRWGSGRRPCSLAAKCARPLA